MPEPFKDEKEKDFVPRCIPIVIEDGAAKDVAQAIQVCNSIYRESLVKGVSMRVGKNKHRKRLIKSYTITELSLERAGTHGFNRPLLVKTAGTLDETEEKVLCKSHSSLVKVEETEEEGHAWFVIQRGDYRDGDGDKFPLKAHEKAIHDLYNSGFTPTKLHKLNEDKSITSTPADYKLGELHIERSPNNIFGVPENTSIGMAMFDKTDPDWKAVKSGELLTFSFVADINEFEYEDEDEKNNLLTKNNGDTEMNKKEINEIISERFASEDFKNLLKDKTTEEKSEETTEENSEKENLTKSSHINGEELLSRDEVLVMISDALKNAREENDENDENDEDKEESLTKAAVAELIDKRISKKLIKSAQDQNTVEPNPYGNGYLSII